MNQHDITEYSYGGAGSNVSHAYVLPRVLSILDSLGLPVDERRLFDLGCGNGLVAAAFTAHGWQVVGVDPSKEGIGYAQDAHPHLVLEEGSCYDDLAARFGRFPVVTTLEVVEHVYSPHKLVQCIHSLLEPGGWAIISTPYHGYWKNLALALTGKFDAHFTPLSEHGHIKFWSRRTLRRLMAEADLHVVRFTHAGRIAPFAKSMIALARR